MTHERALETGRNPQLSGIEKINAAVRHRPQNRRPDSASSERSEDMDRTGRPRSARCCAFDAAVYFMSFTVASLNSLDHTSDNAASAQRDVAPHAATATA